MRMKKMNRLLAIVVSLVMLLSVFPTAAFTAFAENGAAADDWASLQAAFNEGGTVTLSSDVTAPAGAAALTVPSRTRVTLYLNDCTIDRALTEETEKGSVIIVSGELDVFGPGTITGGNTSGSGGGLWVKRGGSVVLDEDVVVSGNHAKYTGGGVYVSGSNASFSMMDGTSITNNSAKNGGGLAQDSTGCLSVFSGSISNNTAANNGGGIWYGGGSGAALNLLGGEISGNTAGNDGGGVYANRSVFSMSENSSIINNTAGHSGGGVFFGGDVFVPDGTISGNTAPTDPEIGAKDANSIPSYTITVSGAIVGGTVTADKASAKYGEAVTLTVTPASEDYVPDYLTVTGADGSPVALTGNTFVMPPTDVTVTATFREKREFRVETQDYDSSTDHGRVYLEDFRTDAWIYEGDTVTAFALPDSGLIAASWTVLMQDELSGEYIYAVPDVSHPTPNTISFTMPSADVLVSATFSESHDQRLVFINDMEGGTVVSDKTLVGRQDDEQVTLTILPGNGYRYEPDSLRLMDVDRDNGSQLDITPYMTEITENSVYSIFIGSGDLYVYADFERVPEQPKHCVVVDSETDNGTISADLDLAEEGWTVKVTANPDAYRGYAVKSVTVTDEDGATYPVTALGYNEYKFTMPATDVFVTAEFGIPVYAITTYCPSAAATGCELETDEEAETGDDVAVWLTVFDEFLLESLTVTGDTSGAGYPISLDYHRDGSALYRYKFNMPGEPVTVSAVFGTMKYALTVNEAVEGVVTFTVDGEAATKAAYGKRVDVTYVYENKAGTYEDLVNGMTYSYTMNGLTAQLPLNDLTITDGVCTGYFSMPSSPAEIGASYISIYTVSFGAVQDGSIEASSGGVPHTAPFRVYPGETVWIYASSSVSDKVRADWSVTYTDETGEHSAAVTRITDSYASFIMPVASVTISAELTPLGVPYMSRSWNSTDNVLTEQLRYYTGNYTALSSLTDDTISGGWYVLDGNLTFGNRITISGHVRLILTDGMTLTAEKGIRVPEGATLSIYGQANDIGKLIATAGGYNAAIGSNDEDDGDEDAAGTIIIYGGTIEATGDSDAAGIGGGNEAGGGNVTVYGGTVTATGGDYGAGIGSGDEPENGSAGSYTQYGGTVTANGGKEAAGVGGGNDCDGGTVTIWDGKLEATGLGWGKEASGAGIGGGDDGDGGTVTIHGGDVTAKGDYFAAGIGGGEHGITGTVTINGGEVHAKGGDLGAGIGTGDGKLHSEMNENTGSVTINGGKVYATGGYNGAGIGGGNEAGGVTITINDGYVNAKGGGRLHAGAGIGSGYESGINADITIYGGTVIATGGTGDSEYVNAIQAYGGAGIGTGDYGDSDNNHTGRIIIKGGTVSAYGGRGSAGIGGGYHSPAEIVEISGGSVSAGGSSHNDTFGAIPAAGIGCGAYGDEEYGSVTITGGTVTVSSPFSTDTDYVPYAIGISKNCDENDMPAGFLTLDGKMCVRPTVNDAPVAEADRISACMKGHRTAVISECAHDDNTFLVSADFHMQTCRYCATGFPVGDHTFAGEDHVCSVCGYPYGGALYTVSFDANGGSGEMNSVTVIPGGCFDLPACDFTAPAGKTFGGWSVAIDGGTVIAKVGDPITVDGDKIVSAAWEDILYPVNVEATSYGTVTADKESAAMGETVHLTVTPTQGFRLVSLTVTDETDGAVEVVDGSFTMPIGGATVSAVFELDPDIVNANLVKDLIEAIGEVEYTDESKNKIDAAETAYDALTDAQKELVTNYATLTAARDRYAELQAAAEQAAADREAADAVEAKIDAIGSVEYTDACKAKIDEARDAYDALTDAQKALVENYDELEGAEAAYAYLKAEAEATQADHTAAAAVKEKIYDIGTVEYTEACKVKIDEARDAYDALTDTQKALVTNYETLTAAEASYAALKAAADQAAADQAAADEVIEKINAIGTVEYTEASKTKIDAAREAYNALTDAQKALVDNYDTLTAAEDRYAELKAAAEQAEADQAAANAVKDAISAIGEVEYTEASKAKIDEAREAYNALTDAQKELVDNYAALTAAEDTYAELQAAEQAEADRAAADAVIAKIGAIGTVTYTSASKKKIDAARSAYDALTDAQKRLVTNYKTLTDAEARYAALKKAAADQKKADAVKEKIDSIGEVELTDACKAKIDAARTAYNALTKAQKRLVTNYETLTDAEARYEELKAATGTPTDPTDPTEPTNPDDPSGDNICKWDNVDHGTSFWGRLVKFFHSVLYFFAHLFGTK
ncbi:MAG: InlB B-repeat-containing protein [Clostridia bacterium]|nr:InlB B-repeat-containing protein [Clostridia bacterium]